MQGKEELTKESLSPPSHDIVFQEEVEVEVEEEHEEVGTSPSEDQETSCWGCGLRVLVSPYAPVFKCGWCGAITNRNAVKKSNKYFWWRRFRDRCFVCVILLFMLFFICGGIWGIYPVVFSVSNFCGFFHLTIAVFLSISTVSTFSFAAFRSAGAPPSIPWGSYPAVGKGGLENYTFCHYCSKPKSPRAHHCRSCGMCILDMDHHCPFIGNCVGAENHRSFIIFLISAVTSTMYVSVMSSYAALQIWPPLHYKPPGLLNASMMNMVVLRTLKYMILAFWRSAAALSARGLILLYLFIASVSVEIGLSILLWQQLCYIYEGKTYLSHLSEREGDEVGEKDCQNIVRFFGCPYSATRCLPSFRRSKKSHEK